MVQYSTDEVWTIGETQTIKWTTTYSNYTIALWQQTVAGGSATLGSVIYQTTSGGVTEFDWVVQIFEFDLATSNVFFLWLHEGSVSDQGSAATDSVTSHYVNFTNPVTTTTTTTTSSSSAATLSTASSKTETKAAYTQTSASSITPQSTTSSTAQTQTTLSSSTGSLSTGAQAGIGVGASLIGLAAAVGCGVYIWRGRRKNQAVSQHPAPVELGANDGPPPVYTGFTVEQKEQDWTAKERAEMEAPVARPPVELDGDPLGFNR